MMARFVLFWIEGSCLTRGIWIVEMCICVYIYIYFYGLPGG